MSTDMDADRLLSTEPRTEDRLQMALEIGELVLCMAEVNDKATPTEIEALIDALPSTTLSELVSLALEGIRTADWRERHPDWRCPECGSDRGDGYCQECGGDRN